MRQSNQTNCIIKMADDDYQRFSVDHIFFEIHTQQILYLEDYYHPQINNYILKNYEKIQTLFAKKTNKFNIPYSLIYIPKILQEPENFFNSFEDTLLYYLPLYKNLVPEILKSTIHSFTSANFTNLFFKLINFNGKIYPGFLHVLNDNLIGYSQYDFSYVRINGENDATIEFFIQDYISKLKEADPYIFYQLAGRAAKNYVSNLDRQIIIKEIREKIQMVEQQGYLELLMYVLRTANIEMSTISSKTKIDYSFSENAFLNQLSHLTITKDFKIVLNDYNNLEIKITPLPKAIFILFLRHPEGIYLKYLDDYKGELLHIYKNISYRETPDEIEKSINELIDPTKNSIHEKCSRIKEAFIKHINDDIAQHYYITGKKGDKKSIKLDQNLINWEINSDFLPVITQSKTDFEILKFKTEEENTFKYGLNFFNNKDYNNAIQSFSKTLNYYAYNVEALFYRAIAYFEVGNYSAAINDNSKLLQIDPYKYLAYHNRAEAYLLLGNYHAALNDITFFLQNYDNLCKDSYFMRGLIYEGLNELYNACQDWVNARELNHQSANKMLQKYSHIQIEKAKFEILSNKL